MVNSLKALNAGIHITVNKAVYIVNKKELRMIGIMMRTIFFITSPVASSRE